MATDWWTLTDYNISCRDRIWLNDVNKEWENTHSVRPFWKLNTKTDKNNRVDNITGVYANADVVCTHLTSHVGLNTRANRSHLRVSSYGRWVYNPSHITQHCLTDSIDAPFTFRTLMLLLSCHLFASMRCIYCCAKKLKIWAQLRLCKLPLLTYWYGLLTS